LEDFWAVCFDVFFVVFIVISGFNGGSYGCPMPDTVGALPSTAFLHICSGAFQVLVVLFQQEIVCPK